MIWLIHTLFNGIIGVSFAASAGMLYFRFNDRKSGNVVTKAVLFVAAIVAGFVVGGWVSGLIWAALSGVVALISWSVKALIIGAIAIFLYRKAKASMRHSDDYHKSGTLAEVKPFRGRKAA